MYQHNSLHMARLLHLDVKCVARFVIVRGRSREFIKACFYLKTHRFLPLSVLGNRSKTLLLPIICKPTDLPTASRLRSEGTGLKSHRLNIRILIHQAFLQIRILPFLLQSQQLQLPLLSYQERPISPLQIWNSTHPL